MTLVAGVDSSTQSCKVVVRDAVTGRLVRQGRAAHPEGTEVHPAHWWAAFLRAVEEAGGLDDVAAISVAGQQHGMVCLDETGQVVRDALLWNDTRSAEAAAALVAELGGPTAWAEAVGSVPVASFTIAKLRWLAEHEPGNARRVAAVCLPHDWLTWRLAGALGLPFDAWADAPPPPLDHLTTDRGDASGTGYWSPATGAYRTDLLKAAFGAVPLLPRVLGPVADAATPDAPAGPGADALARGASAADLLARGTTTAGEGSRHGGDVGRTRIAPGTGDNMAAALGVGARPGDVVVSIGTSGTVFAVSDAPSADPSGQVAGFADATGRFLPLVCTLNAARVMDAAARLTGVGLDRLGELALQAPAGAGGLTLVPYLEGERTPNQPTATGAVHGLTLATSTPAHLARAAIEGMLCGLADGLDALGLSPERVLLIGGGARSEAVRRIAPTVFGRPVLAPPPGEYVADGAAYQAAWLLDGDVAWSAQEAALYEADAVPDIRHRYAAARPHILDRPH
ncbi:xylulokinase [Nonomuraea roseoviolacea]|uniref:Xylulose kinase n=1 Tax=Nonomuraea roseoviolacea subsp. carminata TaxID=160689 RepID=A0ABT1JZ76_9ACTN|nr:FGGY family carbohydrate kinase [Nonomuraea roseoviolacea]MCP2347036.1 xylulokinase [Nonomuraea roseoviolacea subsp. carminata]